MVAENRKSNFELLRIFLIFFVIILHFNNTKGGKVFSYVEIGSINYYFSKFLEAIAIGAVNCFIMLSGYFLANNYKRDIKKPLLLIVTVMVYHGLNYCINIIMGGTSFNLHNFVVALIPSNYYVWLYSAVYLISPYVNLIFLKLSKKQCFKMLGIFTGLFALYPTMIDVVKDVFGISLGGISTISANETGAGYTLVNFLLCYCVGVYLRKYNFEKADLRHSIGGYLISVLSIFGMYLFTNTAIEYSNPLVIIEAAFLILIFKNIDIAYSKTINFMAKSTFNIYLIHGWGILMKNWWGGLPIEEACRSGILMFLGVMFISVCSMYIFSLLISIVTKTIGKPVVRVISRLPIGIIEVEMEV